MKPLSELSKDDIKDIKIICFDTDGVTVKRGTDIEEKGSELRIKTNILEDRILEKLNRLKKYFHVTVNSGRSSLYLAKMYQGILWDNSSVISEIGIFILHQGKLIQNFVFTDYELSTIRNITLELKKIAENNPHVKGFEPKQFLITLHCYQAIPEIDEIVKRYDTNNEFYCWWNGEAYDICPHRFNKGSGLLKLCDILGVTVEQTMAIGNGINDRDMIDIAGISITTDKNHLVADYFIDGEHLGGEILIDKLLELLES